MSHFYASIQGDKGEATRCGSKDSGSNSHTRGWNLGVAIEGYHHSGEDFFQITITSGSTDKYESYNIGLISLDDGIPVFKPYTKEGNKNEL